MKTTKPRKHCNTTLSKMKNPLHMEALLPCRRLSAIRRSTTTKEITFSNFLGQIRTLPMAATRTPMDFPIPLQAGLNPALQTLFFLILLLLHVARRLLDDLEQLFVVRAAPVQLQRGPLSSTAPISPPSSLRLLFALAPQMLFRDIWHLASKHLRLLRLLRLLHDPTSLMMHKETVEKTTLKLLLSSALLLALLRPVVVF